MTTDDEERQARLALVISNLIGVRGARSPEHLNEKIADRYAPDATPLSDSALRRLAFAKDDRVTPIKLQMLNDTFGLPAGAMHAVWTCDVEALEMMRFSDEDEARGVREFVIRLITTPLPDPTQSAPADGDEGRGVAAS